MSEQPEKNDNLRIDDLPDGFGVTVAPGWRGPASEPTWTASLFTRDLQGDWRRRNLPVMNDDGPIEAVRDLLSLLESGEPARSA